MHNLTSRRPINLKLYIHARYTKFQKVILKCHPNLTSFLTNSYIAFFVQSFLFPDSPKTPKFLDRNNLSLKFIPSTAYKILKNLNLFKFTFQSLGLKIHDTLRNLKLSNSHSNFNTKNIKNNLRCL